jgi:hypothetical protein
MGDRVHTTLKTDGQPHRYVNRFVHGSLTPPDLPGQYTAWPLASRPHDEGAGGSHPSRAAAASTAAWRGAMPAA